jgi:very-short-patch-repair endonuclease
MRTIHDLPESRVKRRILRKEMTPQERKLWARIRRNQLGVKFRRQHSIGRYIVDFYCPEKHVVLEIDGGQHFERRCYDAERTKYLESLGMTVLRFWNNEINENIEGVILKITKEIGE